MIQFNFETRLKLPFKIIRLIDDRLESSLCELELLLTINSTDDTDESKTRLKAIKMFVETYVDECISYPARTDLDTTMFSELSNYIMMCPDDPHDHMLLMLLHTKLSALGGDHVILSSSTLSSDTSEGFSCTIRGPVGDCLPTMTEWMGERHFHASPWWYRADSSMTDMLPNDEEDLSKTPDLGDDIILIARESNTIKDAIESGELDDEPKQAEIIRPKFKPRVIEIHD